MRSRRSTKAAGGRPATARFSQGELAEYRRLLLRKRVELLGDVSTLSQTAENQNQFSGLSHLPTHPGDAASDNLDRDLTLGLMECEQQLLREIEAALQRLEAGTYGICETTGRPIPAARLEVMPWARQSLEAVRAEERRTHAAPPPAGPRASDDADDS